MSYHRIVTSLVSYDSTTSLPINATFSTLGSFPTPSISNCTCQNALLSMSYLIQYQLSGSISGVQVNLVMTSITGMLGYTDCIMEISYQHIIMSFSCHASSCHCHVMSRHIMSEIMSTAYHITSVTTYHIIS